VKKAKFFTRQELYDLVWEEPRTHLAKRIGLSDVAIAKACRKAGIPMPSTGHWAKKAAGKRVSKVPLPPRDPGVDDEIKLGGHRYDYGRHWTDAEVCEMAPQPPVFEESLDEVRQRVKGRLGKVAQPRSLKEPHRAIARLLEEDEVRREKANSSSFSFSWDEPKFDSPTEKRRLRILSGIFVAAGKCGARGVINSKDAREVGVTVGDQFVRLNLETLDSGKKAKAQMGCARERFRLAVGHSWHRHGPEPLVWEDSSERDLESMLPEIVLELILMGERQYRGHTEYQYQNLVDRKAELEEKERQRIEAEARLERERVERLKQARIQRLLDEAAAHRQACDIREYVDRVLTSLPMSLSGYRENAEAWAEWAREQADALDPITTGRLDMSEPELE